MTLIGCQEPAWLQFPTWRHAVWCFHVTSHRMTFSRDITPYGNLHTCKLLKVTRVCDVIAEVTSCVTSGRLAPKSWVCQILNFENRTTIKGDIAENVNQVRPWILRPHLRSTFGHPKMFWSLSSQRRMQTHNAYGRIGIFCHKMVRLEKDWIVPTRWSWIAEPPSVGQAPSWLCMMKQPHMEILEICHLKWSLQTQ